MVVTPEFSRSVAVETMAGGESVREISASPAECRALAARLGLAAIDGLRATIRLRRVDGGAMVRVRGRIEADVVQTCVVSLEPVPAHVEEDFGALFAPEDEMPDENGDLLLDPLMLDEDLPEPMTGGVIDIGELAAQHLSLALDPYPRRSDAAFAGHDDDAIHPESAANPFKALAALKRPDESAG